MNGYFGSVTGWTYAADAAPQLADAYYPHLTPADRFRTLGWPPIGEEVTAGLHPLTIPLLVGGLALGLGLLAVKMRARS